MQTFTLTVDDNIRFLRDLTEHTYKDIFDNPYLAVYKRLHDRFGLKVQLNLFYRMENFDLSMMTARYASQWRENAHWLKMSFHSDVENEWPYIMSGYDEVYSDCANVHEQIVRFAGRETLARTTTLHYCAATLEGVRALKDHGVEGLLGLFGEKTDYSLPKTDSARVRSGEIIKKNTMVFAPIDLVLNTCTRPEITSRLNSLLGRKHIGIMIHEQYFYSDYIAYQPDFEAKLADAAALLCERGYQSKFFEELIV